MAAALFWLSIAGLGYIFVGYPLLVWVASRLTGSTETELKRSGGAATEPLTATVLIAAHNETDTLVRKLHQLIACDAVAAVRVGIDGASDDVVAAVESVADARVRAVPFPERQGKPAILSKLIPTVTTPVIVMADARQPLAPEAIEALLDRLQDPDIGVVSGELVFRPADEAVDGAAANSTSEGVGAYWRYEKFIRKCESNFRGVPGATGALYAIRTSLARPIADNTLLDDVVIPMQAVETGAKCVFEPRAVVYDQPSTQPGKEAIRKRRTIAGAAQLAIAQPRWLLPWRNPIWWEFVSHKLARLAAPLLLVVALAANAWLARESRLYAVLLGLHLAFYAAAALGYAAQRAGRRLPGLSLPLMFVTLNATTALALLDASRGRFQAAWKR